MNRRSSTPKDEGRYRNHNASHSIIERLHAEGRGRRSHYHGDRNITSNQNGTRSHLRSSHSIRSHSRSLGSDLFCTNTNEPWYKYKTRPPITNDEKIKSEMCRNLQENGSCPYGASCRFAHDESELKKIIRHPKHKTQLCRDYHGEGHCTFGSRCSYIHEPKESKLCSSWQTETPSDLYTSSGRDTMNSSSHFNFSVLSDHDKENSSEECWHPLLNECGLNEGDQRTISKLPAYILHKLLRDLSPPHADSSQVDSVLAPTFYFDRLETRREPASITPTGDVPIVPALFEITRSA